MDTVPTSLEDGLRIVGLEGKRFDRLRCPMCKRKTMALRARTDDFRCKECGEIRSRRYFDAHEAVEALMKRANAIRWNMMATDPPPEKPRGIPTDDKPYPMSGCFVSLLVAIAVFVGVMAISGEWAIWWRMGAASVASLITLIVVALKFSPPSAPPPPDHEKMMEKWAAEFPELQKLQQLSHGFAVTYGVNPEGTYIRLINPTGWGFDTLEPAVKRHGTDADLAELTDVADKFKRLHESGDASILLGPHPSGEEYKPPVRQCALTAGARAEADQLLDGLSFSVRRFMGDVTKLHPDEIRAVAQAEKEYTSDD